MNPPNNPDKITAQELRQQFADLHTEIESLRAELLQLKEGLTQAAASKPAAASETYRDFDATEIVLSYNDKGEPTYKLKGQPFLKFGIRVWPEVLPELGINPNTLKPGPNPIKCKVRALVANIGESGTVSMRPKKIIGKA